MSKNNYVDNKQFLAALIQRKVDLTTALEKGQDPPLVSNYIGKTIFDICTHFSYRPNFINYSFRDEMIGDGIEDCIKAVDKFDSEKYNNPFAYFTQIAFYAFLRRIEKEKEEQYIKFKLLEELPADEMIEMIDGDSGDAKFMPAIDFMRDNSYFDTREFENKKNMKKKKNKTPIEEVLDEGVEK